MINPEKEEKKNQATDKDNYESAVKQCIELRRKLEEGEEERHEQMKQITMLTEELKIQDQHFTQELQIKTREVNGMKQNSISKDSDLLKKLQSMSDQNTKNEKQHFEMAKMIRDNDEMAKSKIHTLEKELEQQNKFFKKEEINFEEQI